jgi:hypothetical protein
MCYAFSVSSKDKPVKKSTVTLNGHHASTSSAGKTTLCLKLSKGTHGGGVYRVAGEAPASGA